MVPQPASASIAVRNGCGKLRKWLDGLDPTFAYSWLSRFAASPSLPRKQPPTWTVGVLPPGAAARCRFDHIGSGACGAQDCQPATTRAACAQGQDRENKTGWGAGTVRNVNDVTTPKFPPPPPWQP